MPKETPKIAGTIMNTSNSVNHTVNEIPSRMHNKLSKGLKKSSILKSGGVTNLMKYSKSEGRRLHYISRPKMALHEDHKRGRFLLEKHIANLASSSPSASWIVISPPAVCSEMA